MTLALCFIAHITIIFQSFILWECFKNSHVLFERQTYQNKKFITWPDAYYLSVSEDLVNAIINE